ncbi:MAG: hypothetical protein KGN31_04955 [Betaproteobacteria bacterium]|nr:hypothetical protein [Betaproteobacteria bacterium]MDE2423543.1 hypothetical protein [Betaproteobacteria bacterium]
MKKTIIYSFFNSVTLLFLLLTSVYASAFGGGHPGGGHPSGAFQGRGGYSGHEGYYGHERFERNYVGFGFGYGFGPPFWGDPFWAPFPYYAPLYYPPAPTVVVTQPPSPPVTPQGTTYIAPSGNFSSPPPPSQSLGISNDGYFYCPDNKGVYPQVKSCPGAWQRLPLVPPGPMQ